MADVGAVLSKIRALGADVLLKDGSMVVGGSVHLNEDQRNWIAANREAIEKHLRSASRADAPAPSEDDTAPYTWGQFARILYSHTPEGADAFDWSWFITTAGKIVRDELGGVQS